MEDTSTSSFGGGMGGWLFAFLIIYLISSGGFGGNNKECVATQSDVTNGFNNNATQSKLDQISLSSANNNYETAKLLSDQNLLNVQGYNEVNTNLLTYTNTITSNMADLSYHMDQCCCQLKAQMLQDKYDALQSDYQAAQNQIANSAQTEYILGSLGKFYPLPPVNPYNAYNSCQF